MTLRQAWRWFVSAVRRVLLAELVLAALAGLAWWLTGGDTARQYGQALMWTGLFALGLAGAAFTGTAQLLSSPSYWYAQSVMPDNMFTRWRQNMAGLDNDVPVTALLAVCGLLTVLVGVWVQTF